MLVSYLSRLGYFFHLDWHELIHAYASIVNSTEKTTTFVKGNKLDINKDMRMFWSNLSMQKKKKKIWWSGRTKVVARPANDGEVEKGPPMVVPQLIFLDWPFNFYFPRNPFNLNPSMVIIEHVLRGSLGANNTSTQPNHGGSPSEKKAANPGGELWGQRANTGACSSSSAAAVPTTRCYQLRTTSSTVVSFLHHLRTAFEPLPLRSGHGDTEKGAWRRRSSLARGRRPPVQ